MVSIAAKIEQFLGKYQTDDPMVPFLINDMYVLMEGLFTRIVRPSQMNNVKSITDLLKIDLEDLNNLKLLNTVDIGFAANCALNKGLKTKEIKDVHVAKFRQECRKFRIMIEKLEDKLPLTSKLLHGASCFAPDIMLVENIAKQRADALLSFLVDRNRLCAIDTDRIKKEYSDFITKDNIKKQLKEFNLKKTLTRYVYVSYHGGREVLYDFKSAYE